MNGLEQEALLGPFECDGRSLVPAAQHGRAAVHAEIAANLRLSAVALETPRLQDWLDPGFKKAASAESSRFASFSAESASRSQHSESAVIAIIMPARLHFRLARTCGIGSLPVCCAGVLVNEPSRSYGGS